MKTIHCMLVFLIVASFPVYAEMFGRTPADVYTDSYSAQMKNQMRAQSSAEIRAEEYGARYSQCDEHHRCGNEASVAEMRSPEITENIGPNHDVPPLYFSPL